MARTELFARKQPGGVVTISNVERHPGAIFFVCSATTGATDGAGYGINPDAPFATIDYAVGKCTANAGDVIYVLPGHAETVSEAGGLDLDVAGITIIGIGNGSLQPTVTLDTADTADVDIDAANITVENIHFKANFADIAAAIDVNADDFTLRRCRFSETATDMNALIWIQDALVTASDRITVEDCRVTALDAANTHFINLAGTGDGHLIQRNLIIGDFGTVCIGGAGVVTNCIVLDNRIYNISAAAEAAIHLADTATGIVMGNMAGGTAAQAQGIGATACALAENYYGDLGGDVSAILEPIAT
jgi:hypothetical protein